MPQQPDVNGRGRILRRALRYAGQAQILFSRNKAQKTHRWAPVLSILSILSILRSRATAEDGRSPAVQDEGWKCPDEPFPSPVASKRSEDGSTTHSTTFYHCQTTFPSYDTLSLMHWVASSEKDTTSDAPEKRRDAAVV